MDTLRTSSFILEFVAVWKKGVYIARKQRGGKILVVPKDYHGIMTELINTFEKWPMDITMVEREAAVKIKEWIQSISTTTSFRFINLSLFSDVTIKVKGAGRIKTVCIHIAKGFLLLIFEIKKKQKMSLLRTLAAEKISDCISKREDIKQLEVPSDVMDDLNEAYDDCWRVQYNTADSTEEPKTIII